MAIADCHLEEEEEDLEKMESDVKDLALKVSNYRKSLADNLKNNFGSAISSHRPNFHNVDSESEEPVIMSRSGAHLRTEELESPGRYVQLKETVWENVTTMPLVTKRMRECKETIDKSSSSNGTIHPAFTRRKAY